MASSGLLRCGKSCRLRWTNYLRPDIKRGNFSVEEEESIIKLHQILGNRNVLIGLLHFFKAQLLIFFFSLIHTHAQSDKQTYIMDTQRIQDNIIVNLVVVSFMHLCSSFFHLYNPIHPHIIQMNPCQFDKIQAIWFGLINSLWIPFFKYSQGKLTLLNST